MRNIPCRRVFFFLYFFLFYFLSFHFTNKCLQLGSLRLCPPPTPPPPPPLRITASTNSCHLTPSTKPKNGRDRDGREGGCSKIPVSTASAPPLSAGPTSSLSPHTTDTTRACTCHTSTGVDRLPRRYLCQLRRWFLGPSSLSREDIKDGELYY